MDKQGTNSAGKQVDSIQHALTRYACELDFARISPEAIHAAKLAVIDTLGALVAGFAGEPCRIARDLAAQMPNAEGATVIGTRMKSTPDIAAFVNGTTARYAEMTDIYHWPGSSVAHPSDVIAPILAAAEHAHASGREFITAVVLAYEVCLRISHVFKNEGYDNTNLCCIGSAVGAGKVLRLSPEQLAHCISMAVVPNNILKQARRGQKSMYKAVAAGEAGRGGVFAAMLARVGMEGPHLPFEGKEGWCAHVAGGLFSLGPMGGNGVPFKILDVRTKNRPAAGPAIAAILAAEKLAPLNIAEIKQVIIEVHKDAKERTCIGEPPWSLESREDADHSTPYLVAITLRDGTVTLHSFDDVHLWNPELRALMKKIEAVENVEFTKAYKQVPQAHRARVVVVTNSGERLVADAGGDADDLAAPKSAAQIEEKFRSLAQESLSQKRADALLEQLWKLEDLRDVGAIPPGLVLV